MLDTFYTTQPDSADIAAWNAEMQAATPQELLEWAGEHWGDQMALTCSFGGAAGMVLLDMVIKVAPQTPILYIDTGVLFSETYEVVEQVRRHYGIEPIAVQPRRTLGQQAEDHGDELWLRDPHLCCGLRKVEPLATVLAPFHAWITGIRRENGPTRAHAQLLEWSKKYNLVKLNPLINWSERSVWRYINDHAVPYNPLLNQGYSSLGCATCTRLPNGDDPRSGRWVGFNKTECGLHLEGQ
ncbi:MAG: phosphoadenylyl-sulfate reductase [Herpetosiphon sp.]